MADQMRGVLFFVIAIAAAAYGQVCGITGLENVSKFIIGLWSGIMIIAWWPTDRSITSAAEKPVSRWRWFNRTMLFTYLSALVWHGAVWIPLAISVLWLLHISGVVDKRRELNSSVLEEK